MINQIAYMVSFNDKNIIKSDVNFTNYIYSYDKGKMFDLINKAYDNSIFFIGETLSKFNNIFFKLGFLYSIMKENNFIGKISINKTEYIINNFSDYYDIIGSIDVTCLNAETGGRKYSFTFISCDKIYNFMDILKDFTKIKGNNTNINVNFIYEIDSKSPNFKKIIDININLNKNETKKIKFNPKIKLITSSVSPSKNTKYFRPDNLIKPKNKLPIFKPTKKNKIADDTTETHKEEKNTNIIKYNHNNSQLIDDIIDILNILDTGKMKKK